MGAGEGQQGARQHTHRGRGRRRQRLSHASWGPCAPHGPHTVILSAFPGSSGWGCSHASARYPLVGRYATHRARARSNRKQRKRVVLHLLPPAQARELAPSRKTSAPHALPPQETAKHHTSSFRQSRSGAGCGAARRTRLPRPRRRGSRRGRARGPRRAPPANTSEDRPLEKMEKININM